MIILYTASEHKIMYSNFFYLVNIHVCIQTFFILLVYVIIFQSELYLSCFHFVFKRKKRAKTWTSENSWRWQYNNLWVQNINWHSLSLWSVANWVTRPVCKGHNIKLPGFKPSCVFMVNLGWDRKYNWLLWSCESENLK